MINRLLPEQVSKLWDIIKYAIEESLPPIVTKNSDSMNRILASLLSGKMSCWVLYTKNEGMNRFDAVVLTKIVFDDATYTKNLLLYSVYGYAKMEPRHWMEGFAFMSKYALAQGCDRLLAYTNVPYLIEMAKQYDADMQTFISFNINKSVQILNKLSGE